MPILIQETKVKKLKNLRWLIENRNEVTDIFFINDEHNGFDGFLCAYTGDKMFFCSFASKQVFNDFMEKLNFEKCSCST